MPVAVSTNAGIVVGEKLFPVTPDFYVAHNDGLAYVQDEHIIFGNHKIKLLDKPIIGLAYANGQFVVAYEDLVVTESGRRMPMRPQKNLRVTIEPHQIQVMNGRSVHLFGMFNRSFVYDDVVLNFSYRSPFDVNPTDYRVYTISKTGLFRCFVITDDGQTESFTKQAKIVQTFGDYVEFEVELIYPTRYIVNFETCFYMRANRDVVGITSNGQNMIVEFASDPYFVCLPFGTDDEYIIPEPIKNIKSARKTG